MPHAHALMCVAGSPQSASQPANPFHEKMTFYLSQGYAVAYVVENNVTQVVQNLSKIGMPVEDYVESGALKIIDAGSFYSLSKLDHNILLLQWHKVLSSISKKSFKGVMVMGMPHEAFFDNKENQQKLIEYEEQVAKNYDNSFQVFCCYTKELLDKLPLDYLIRLLAAHQDVATNQNDNGLAANFNNSTNYPRHVSRLVNLVEEGLATALGKETSALVLKTLKLVYKINKDDIVANPELFEEKIKRMFGDSGEPVLKIIAERLKTEIMYSR
jgi:hypothetical protein